MKSAASRDTPSLSSLERVRRELDVCYQCRRCSAGCPVAAWADHPPHRIVQWVREGATGRAVATIMVWVCASCLTCSARCPNGVPVAELMDTLKQMVLDNNSEVMELDVLAAHRAFLREVRRRGRLHELSMIRRYKLKTGHLFQDAKLGLALLLRRKLKFFPERVEVPDAISTEKKE